MQVTDGVVCVLTTQVSKFSGINLFLTRHTNRPAFLSTEKEIIKAEHIIKQIYITRDFIMYPQNNQVESNNSKNANIANITNDGKMMSSREIANLTEKQHSHICRDIRRMLEDLEMDFPTKSDDPKMDHPNQSEFKVIYDNRNYMSEILLNFDLTMTLIAGYNVVLRNRIIKRWQELEKAAAKPSEPDLREFCIREYGVPKNYAEALTAMAELETQRQALEDKVSQQHQILIEQDLQIKQKQKSVDALESISASPELLKFRQVAKILNLKESVLRQWLLNNKWTQWVNRTQIPHQTSINKKFMVSKFEKFNHAHGTNVSYFTAKGLVELAKIFTNLGIKINDDRLLSGYKAAVLENQTLESDKIF